MQIRQGDVFFGELPPLKGIISGSRPVVIISNDRMNHRREFVTVAPITGIDLSDLSPTHVKVFADKYPVIGQDTIVFVDHSRPIPKESLRDLWFRLDRQDMELIIKSWKYCVKDPDNYIETHGALVFEKNEKIRPEIDEDRDYEFKEYKIEGTYDTPSKLIKDKFGEYVCAWLNGDGGRIFFGVSNDATVTGVQLSKIERDELRKDLGNLIRDNFSPKFDPSIIRVNFHQVLKENEHKDNLYVVEIITPKATRKGTLYFYKNKPFVKLDGQVEQLIGPQIQDWIERQLSIVR